MGRPKITLEIDGTEELEELIEKLYEQLRDLKDTVCEINAVQLNIQAKINQPPEK